MSALATILALARLNRCDGLFLCSVHALPLNCGFRPQLVFLISPNEFEDGTVSIGNQVERIPSFVIELVPVAQGQLEVIAPTIFFSLTVSMATFPLEYIGLPQNYRSGQQKDFMNTVLERRRPPLFSIEQRPLQSHSFGRGRQSGSSNCPLKFIRLLGRGGRRTGRRSFLGNGRFCLGLIYNSPM